MATVQQDIEVLPGFERHRFHRRELQCHAHHVVAQSLEFAHPARYALDADLLRRRDRLRLDHNFADRPRLTRQGEPFLNFLGGQCQRGPERVIERTLQQPRTARTTTTATSAVRQIDAGMQRRVEDRLIGRDRQALSRGHQFDRIFHAVLAHTPYYWAIAETESVPWTYRRTDC